MSAQKTSYSASAEIQKDGRVLIDAKVTARFHRATGDSDGWATIPFRGTVSLEKLAVFALYDRKLCLTRNLAREAGIKGKFAESSDEAKETYHTLLDIAETEGVNFSAPVVIDPEKAIREGEATWDAMDKDTQVRIMAKKSGQTEEAIRDILSEIGIV